MSVGSVGLESQARLPNRRAAGMQAEAAARLTALRLIISKILGRSRAGRADLTIRVRAWQCFTAGRSPRAGRPASAPRASLHGLSRAPIL